MTLRLGPAPPDSAQVSFTRGKRPPRAIAWFGFSSFWGHLRHLVASVIASENIDSRQWMIPDSPPELLDRVVDVLRSRGARDAPSLVESLGRDAWIDFVSDTGDDAQTSEEVARLLVGRYETDDGLELPRGDVLVLGGDLAYPVATVHEISRRLVDPWNRVLEERARASADDARPRVLLAVPGNHDWYDGLDGFARLCQAPCAFEDVARARASREALHPVAEEHPVLAWAEAFSRGESVTKPGAVALFGYEPVQRASYFRLVLAPGLELFGVDRQLRRVDPRQQAYFRVRDPGVRGRIVITPDPARAWGEVRPNGAATLEALEIAPATDPSLLLAGDVHHYERSREGASVHVVAGGGGAFLHGARIAGGPAYATDAEFPGPRASRALLARLPWHVAVGRAGWVITAVLAGAHAVALSAYATRGERTAAIVALAMSVVLALGTALLIGWRRHRMHRAVPFAAAFGLFIGALPVALGAAIDVVATKDLAPWVAPLLAWLLATGASGFAFGAMLAVIARLGLNHAQPFAALGAPAFKHIVRMRVSRAGTVDVFVIGVVDPVGKSPPVLVDRFTWSAEDRST